METNPIAPRQRNRRADRSAQEALPQQGYSQQPVTPQGGFAQPMAPVQPMAPAQPVAPVQPTVQVQPGYSQTPHTMYQQSVANQPARPTVGSYPQTGAAYPQYRPYPNAATAPAAAPRPRVLNQSGPVNSGWPQPTPRPMEAPHARSSGSLTRETARAAKSAQREVDSKNRQHSREKAESDASKPTRKKLPGWVTTALSLSFLLVLALCAAYWMMQAYLTTQENARIAAYEAVLDNHHVTRAADGTLKVTWQDAIEKYASQYNLQPAFVMAIIRNESSFRTNAESSVGARGLMQLMPDTAEWIAGKLDDSSYTFDRMWDAETNIRYGCWYLGYLSRLFRGDAELVSAAYHAGQSTVTQWLSDPEKSSDGMTLDLDRLSDGPTKQYIGRVTQTYGIYQTLLYPDAAFGAADDMPAGSNSSASGKR